MRRAAIAFALAVVFSVLAAVPAAAAIHPISSLECAAGPTDSVANTQDPPGQVMLGALAPSTAIPASGGAALNGNSGAAVCPNA